jgi:hypothetical protein
MASIQYSLNDYNTILFGIDETPNTYKLPSSVTDIINFLSNKFGADIVDKEKERIERVKKSRYNQKPVEESWINPSGFKPTTFIEGTGTDKIMNDIRAALNKMSSKNYDTNRDIILGLLKNLVDEQKDDMEKEKNLVKIGNNIFDIASTNKFFSEIYPYEFFLWRLMEQP